MSSRVVLDGTGAPNPMQLLPQELLVRILHFCDYRVILLFSRTCRSYLELIKSTLSLRLKIELEANGLQLSGGALHSSRGSLDQLEKLGRYCDDWLSLSFDSRQGVSRGTDGKVVLFSKLHDGIFAQAYFRPSYEDEQAHLMPNSDGKRQANSLFVISFDSDEPRWNLEFDFLFYALAVDSIQDLLVLGCLNKSRDDMVSIRVRSLETGLAHSLAKQFFIPIRLEFSVLTNRLSNVRIDIVDEILVVVLFSQRLNLIPGLRLIDALYEVLILDWRSGILLNRTGVRPGFCGATCLDNDHLLLFVCEEYQDETCAASCFIYDKIRTPCTSHLVNNEGILDVSVHTTLSPILQLGFPVLKTGLKIETRSLSLRSGFSPGGTDRATFVIDGSHRTLEMTMVAFSGSGSRYYTIFADVEKVCAHLARARALSISHFAWEAWGENCTRWFESSRRFNYSHSSIYGSRSVMNIRLPGYRKWLLTVVDFCTPRVRRSKAHKSQNEFILPIEQSQLDSFMACRTGTSFLKTYEEGKSYGENGLVVGIVDEDTPSIIHNLSPDPIVSRLPYRHTTPVLPDHYHKYNWMIDGDRIMGIGPYDYDRNRPFVVRSLRS